jgi:hypothetical protein
MCCYDITTNKNLYLNLLKMTYEKIDIDCFNDEQAVETTMDLLDCPTNYDPSDDLYEEYRERKFLEQEQAEKENQFVIENKDLYLN